LLKTSRCSKRTSNSRSRGWPNLHGSTDLLEQDLTNRIKRGNHTPVVMEEGMELRPFGVSPKDAQALDLRKWIKGQVADEYGVPLGMVGLADDLAAARSAFYTDTLPPYCEEFTKMLNLRVLVRVYNWTDGCFEFNLDEKNMSDDRITSLVSATGRPVMTTNEGRAKLNLPPLDIGDDLITPLNVVAGENPKPSPQVMPVQDPNKPPQDAPTARRRLLSRPRNDCPNCTPGASATSTPSIATSTWPRASSSGTSIAWNAR
jgi:hypothetical protein